MSFHFPSTFQEVGYNSPYKYHRIELSDDLSHLVDRGSFPWINQKSTPFNPLYICGNPDRFYLVSYTSQIYGFTFLPGTIRNNTAYFDFNPTVYAISNNLLPNNELPLYRLVSSPIYSAIGSPRCFSSIDEFSDYYFAWDFPTFIFPAVILASLFFIFIYKMFKRVLFR